MHIRSALILLLTGVAAAQNFPGYDGLRKQASGLWKEQRKPAASYLVLLSERSPLREAAALLAKHRNAEIVPFDPAAPEASLEALIRKGARYVAVFVEPKDMDVNLVRRFIVLSTLMDSDPFCDFAFGFFTASTPAGVTAFVQRSIEVDLKGAKRATTRLSASNVSHCYGTWSFIEGMPGNSWFVKQGDVAYAEKAMETFGKAGFVHFGGCADPEGLWLFDDKRNLDRTKHWPYDPEKVGQDPKGEMPRLTAAHFAKLKLDNAVVWTHACHVGSVGRVWVEGDIVSTFGRCEKVEEYRIPAGRSVGLAIIESGAAAFIAPLGPNHGGQSAIEKAIASETGVPLGDVLRRAYHDVVMDTAGHPEKIGVYVTGKPRRWDPDGFVNYNSPHNRALYGDPLLRPFGDHRSPATVSITVGEAEDGIKLKFVLNKKGYLGRTLYGNRGRDPGRSRIYEVVTLKGAPRSVRIAKLEAVGADGKALPIAGSTALLESLDGKTLLHIQVVSTDRGAFQTKGATVTVTVAAE